MRRNRLVAICVALVATVVAAVLIAAMPQRAKTQAAASNQNPPVKQWWHCGMHPQVIQDHPGFCPICHMKLVPMRGGSAETAPATTRARASTQKTSPEGKGKILYWWDPMIGPSSISDKPGKSAMGMDLVPVRAGEQIGGGVVIDPVLVQNMGVRTAVAQRGELVRSIRAVGMIKLPEPGMHDVSLKVGGWVERLYADREGMHVVKGQPLLDLYSPELQVAEQELIAATKAASAMEGATKQATPAGAENTAPRDEDARSLVESAERKLRLWGIAEQDIQTIAGSKTPPQTVPIRSPATGHVEDKSIVQGSAVHPMARAMRIVDHTHVWLDAQVYQDQAGEVQLGDAIDATVDGLPGRKWSGKITFIYPHLDAASRTLTVRMTIDNPDLALKPGMYATAQIKPEPIDGAVLVPRDAVIDTGTRQFVFVALGNGHFQARDVRMGAVGQDGNVQILGGISPGQKVVTSGQFLMDSESRTSEAIGALTGSAQSQQAPQPVHGGAGR